MLLLFLVGIQNLISKFKSWISTPKSKLVRSTTTTKDMPTTIQREYPTSYDLSSSTIPNSQTISLPFTYYPNSTSSSNHRIQTTNFDQISAWLDRSESLIEEEEEEEDDDDDADQLDLLFIDEFQEQNHSSSSIEIDYQSKSSLAYCVCPSIWSRKRIRTKEVVVLVKDETNKKDWLHW